MYWEVAVVVYLPALYDNTFTLGSRSGMPCGVVRYNTRLCTRPIESPLLASAEAITTFISRTGVFVAVKNCHRDFFLVDRATIPQRSLY